MAKRGQPFSGDQADLFRRLAEESKLEAENAPDLDIQLELRAACAQALKEAKRLRGLSRARVAERMSLCLPRLITERQINAWQAESKEDRPWPAEVIPALCWAAGSALPLLALAGALDYELADTRDRMALELGERLLDQAQAARQVRTLRGLLGG